MCKIAKEEGEMSEDSQRSLDQFVQAWHRNKPHGLNHDDDYDNDNDDGDEIGKVLWKMKISGGI